MKKLLLPVALAFTTLAGAQAFHGKGDTKLQIGFNGQDNANGITGTVDFGLGKNLSYGFSATYLLGADDIAGEKPDFGDRADLKVRLNANIGDVIGIGEKVDVYPGLNLGLRNFGGHVGARYFFTEGFGIYSEVLFPFARYDSSVHGFDHYNNQFTFQIGASFDL
ncbi:DUF6646 family protein [Flavobacterium sp. RHBU_3]|uniref:DUF6646 family protein n=1 Tax=Flavobacterium sp. RHBU_3 TaxID=3391184 RepID=UPI0039847765